MCRLKYGESSRLTVRVTDQSKAAIGSDIIMLSETLGGFYENTVGINYGGIWQDVHISTRGTVYADDLYIDTNIDVKTTTAEFALNNKTSADCIVDVKVEIYPSEKNTASGKATVYSNTKSVNLLAGESKNVCVENFMQDMVLWNINNPFLYTMKITVYNGNEVVDVSFEDFGMTKVESNGSRLVFNGDTIFMTGILSWLVSTDTIVPTPTVAQVEKEITDLKSAGYNTIKFCLVVPPEYVLDICDRMGIYVYIEYPLWLYTDTDLFCERAYLQFEEMVKKDRNHPSIIMSDFSCEIRFQNKLVEMLQKTVVRAKEIDRNRLYATTSAWNIENYPCDDFYTNHPYYQLTVFDEIIQQWCDTFDKYALGSKPVILGEFGDANAMTDYAAVLAANGGQEPWYYAAMGAPRNYYNVLVNNGFSEEQIAQMISDSVKNVEETKVAYLEGARNNQGVAGLFVTHIVDWRTNVTGFYDELGNIKNDVRELYDSGNSTSVMLDESGYNFKAEEKVTLTPSVSHFNGYNINRGILSYELYANGKIIDANVNQTGITLKNGAYYVLNDLEITMPASDGVLACKLVLKLTSDSFEVENSYDIFVYSTEKVESDKTVAVYDPANKLNLLSTYSWMVGWNENAPTTPDAIICTEMTDAITEYLKAGGDVVYIGYDNGLFDAGYSTNFTRKSFTFIADGNNSIVSEFDKNYGGAAFWDLATAYYLPYSNATYVTTQIISNMDTSNANLRNYLAEYVVENGRLLQTTLRLDGGDYAFAETLGGEDPQLHYSEALFVTGENVIGEYLLNKMIEYIIG